MSDLVERAEERLSVSRLGKSSHRETDKDLVVIADLLAENARLANTIQQVRPVLQSLADVVAFSARDWSTARDLAWLWGIVQGWDDDDPECDAMSEQAAIHGWDDHEVARLRQLHAAVTLILDQEPQS